MATKSTIPSSFSEANTQNSETPVSDSPKPDTGVGTSEKPSFLIPEPMREEQVQNAVKFLSHPKVRGSPVIYRRAFLEKKGLTKEEMDEAFHRVPDPSPLNAANVEASTDQKIQANQAKPSTTMQPQASVHTSQPAAGPVVGASSAPSLQQSRFHWSNALFAIGVLTASGAGTAVAFKKMVVPRFKAWIRKVVAEENESQKEDTLKSSVAEEAMEAAKAAATAATVAAKASQEFLSSKNEERKFFEAFMEMMDVQVKEMKSMNDAIHKLENKKENGLSYENLAGEHGMKNGPTETPWRVSQVDHTDVGVSTVFPKQGRPNGISDSDSRSVRSSSPPASVEPLAPAPHPKSYMEIMDMIRRGETPPGIKEVNDLPPNPNQQPSKPLLAPKPKPWEIPQHTQQTSHSFYQYEASNGAPQGQENDQASQLNWMAPDASEPWWKRKTVKITEIKPESEEPRQSNTYGMEYTARPSQRAWVPPQPPAVAMPEAVAAIRQPKPSIQKQQSGDEQLSVQSGDGEAGAIEATDSVVEVKHSSANGGGVEATDSVAEMKHAIATTAPYNSEIQEEETIDATGKNSELQ